MDRVYTGHVVPAEWRWVMFMSLIFLLVIFSPFLVIIILNPPNPSWQFMGVLHDYQDAAASLTRIRQGAEGLVIVPFQYTPEPNPGVLIQPVYPLLGHLARITSLSPIFMFHLMRVFSALFMFLTIYQLAANIWVKIRTRRIFFMVATVGSGAGWFAILSGLSAGGVVPDLQYPMMYPLFSAAANIHYPLTIAALSLLAANLIPALRPGETAHPTVENGGLSVFFASVALAFLFPDALLPIAIAFSVTVIAMWRDYRKINARELYWGLWLLVPSIPVLAYDLLVAHGNIFVSNWLTQRGGSLPGVLMLVLSIVLPLLLALPGLLRALRRFEPDGDRFMLVWLVAMIVTMYLPLTLGQYALAGLMLPVAYFGTRAIEDFWLTYIRRRYRIRIYAVGLLLMGFGHIIWLFMPIVPIAQRWSSLHPNVLNRDYLIAISGLDARSSANDVILASPAVGIWVPYHSGGRVIYGHPAETYQAKEKYAEVIAWYALDDLEACTVLLDRYRVSYVIYGTFEQRLGAGRCLEGLTPIFNQGSITVYATAYARMPEMRAE
jgi:hypothetical protein